MGTTYTVSSGNCPSFSCATSSSLFMLTAGPRGVSLQDGAAAGKGFLCAPFWGVHICDYSAAWISCTVSKRRTMHGASFLNRALHCNHRSGHLKTEHTESLFLLWRHLGNWPRSKNQKRTGGSARKTRTAAAADGVRFARVRWEINFLLTFETQTFICKRTV